MGDLKDVLGKLFKGNARVRSARKRPEQSPAGIQAGAGKADGRRAEESKKQSPYRVADDDPRLPLLRQTGLTARKPPAWVERGTRLQPTDFSGRPLTIRIGLDFGTAFSKIAVRTQDKVLVVSWEGLFDAERPLFVPDELSVIEDDRVCIGRMAYGGRLHSGLKLPLIKGQGTEDTGDADLLAVVFIGSLLKYTRAWLYERHEALVRGRRLLWNLNIGCPADVYTLAQLREQFGNLARYAWTLSRQPGELTLSSARSLLGKEPAPLEEAGLEGIAVVPEFVAEIAGYVFSPQRQDGVHLLVDVGAGTVDIACFNVWNRGKSTDSAEDSYVFPIFSSSVELLGTHILNHRRLQKGGLLGRQWDDATPVVNARTFAGQFGCDEEAIRATDHSIKEAIARAIVKVWQRARQDHYPNAREWDTGVSTFLLGGGSGCDVYRHAIACAEAWSGIRLPLVTIGSLSDLVGVEGLSAGGPMRLAVAHGLTFDEESFGEIKSGNELDPHWYYQPASHRPDRDELYPK